jgi:hypothetical protein
LPDFFREREHPFALGRAVGNLEMLAAVFDDAVSDLCVPDVLNQQAIRHQLRYVSRAGTMLSGINPFWRSAADCLPLQTTPPTDRDLFTLPALGDQVVPRVKFNPQWNLAHADPLR